MSEREEMVDSTCFVKRSMVREILITSNVDNESTKEILQEIDALPIFTAEDMRGAAATPALPGNGDMLRARALVERHIAVYGYVPNPDKIKEAIALELGLSRKRLDRIAEIIEGVDQRCMACDGPVTPTLKEMTQAEISEIYALSRPHRRPDETGDEYEARVGLLNFKSTTDLSAATDSVASLYRGATTLCTGGFDPGWEECPKCGATSDEPCAHPSQHHSQGE